MISSLPIVLFALIVMLIMLRAINFMSLTFIFGILFMSGTFVLRSLMQC